MLGFHHCLSSTIKLLCCLNFFMAAFSITELYDFLSNRFDKETAKNFTSFIEAKINTDLEQKVQILATKEDLLKTESRLELKISETKSETIKWMFLFWVGQVVATFGFILLFLRK